MPSLSHLDLSQLLTVIYQLVQISLFLAVLTLMVVELVKFLIKPRFQRKHLADWLIKLERDGEAEPGKVLFDFEDYVYHLPRRLFMKRVENACQVIMANIVRFSQDYRMITAGAASDHVKAVETWSNDLSRDSRSKDKNDEALNRSFDAVNTALNRNLDDLQMELAQKWVLLVRIVSILTGIFLAALLLFLVSRSVESDVPRLSSLLDLLLVVPLVLAIGAVSGFFASLLYDILSRFLREQDVRY